MRYRDSYFQNDGLTLVPRGIQPTHSSVETAYSKGSRAGNPVG
ncbi:MAG TPA: hypothetical protein VHE59_05080 [Mucilaginibacter sp.]|nr:hypothetical protein [Mucilaginibacter sp.]